MVKRYILAGAVAVIAIGGGLWFLSGTGEQLPAISPASGQAAVAVEAEKVATGQISKTIEAVGNLVSGESVILSPEISGRITEILFDEGEAVAAGDVLIRLDDAINRAELAQVESSLILSEANYNRAKALYAEKTGTGRARDEALAKMHADQAAVALVKARLDKTVLRAPFDGVSGLRRVSPGDYVNPGQALVNLESIDPLKVDFRLPEIHLGVVETGQTIDVRVDAFPDQVFKGEVYAIDPRVDSTGRTIVLRARLPNADGVLRPGLFGRVNLLVSQNAAALLVPEQALIPEGEKRLVYRVIDGKAVLTPVETGQRREGRVEILSGLSKDDVIVTAGQMKLRPDMPVMVLPSPAAGDAE